MAVRRPATQSATQRNRNATAPPLEEETLGQRAARWLATYMQRIGLVLLAGFVLFVVYFVFLGRDGVTAYMQKRRMSEQLQQQMRTLQQENQQMALHNQRLLNDPNAIEDAARRQLHYTRPGEVIYTLPENPDTQPDAAQKPSR
jgi:cell division protein FtsB